MTSNRRSYINNTKTRPKVVLFIHFQHSIFSESCSFLSAHVPNAQLLLTSAVRQATERHFHVSQASPLLLLTSVLKVKLGIEHRLNADRTKVHGEKPVPVPVCPPQISHGRAYRRTRAFAVTTITNISLPQVQLNDI